MRQLGILAVGLAAAISMAGQAPLGDFQSHPSNSRAAAVSYLFPEQITIVAGKIASVELHFKVAAGLHINSHTPHEEELIPTTFKLPEASGVRLVKATFPEGADYSFAINPKEKLSIYSGEFTIHAEVVAAPGEHLVEASLHYQACDSNTCTPPRTIPVAIDVIAK